VTRNAPARFHWRAFVTLYLTLSFLLLAASGIVLYVAPPGRVANWSRWTLGALDRTGWQALHTVVALLFVLAGAFHLWFNWRSLWFYVRTRLAEGLRAKRELALATASVAAVAGLTLADLPPFGSVMDLGERVKESWSTGGGEPPVPHAELLTLERLAATTQIPLDRILANLAAAGVPGAGPRVTIAALASANGLTPQQIWVRLKGQETPKEIPAGGGYGGKTVGEVCTQLEIPLDEGLDRLRARGIEAQAGTPMKDLAERHGRRPHDLVQLLAGA
jgi:Domain of unknown function (DUF4405)